MVYTDGILRPPIGDRVPPSMQFTPNTAPEFHDPERAALIQIRVRDDKRCGAIASEYCSGERDIKDL